MTSVCTLLKLQTVCKTSDFRIVSTEKVLGCSPRISEDKVSVILSLYLFQEDHPYTTAAMTQVKEQRFKSLGLSVLSGRILTQFTN